jgi:hypothetical protein
VDAGDVVVGPQRAGDAVDGPQDLFGLPLVMLEEVLEVAVGLVQVEHEGEADVTHFTGPR